MNFSKRIPFLLFPGGFLGFTFTGMDDDVPTLILTEEEKATLEQQISEFLKIAGTSKGAKDLIEGYLKTTVGAKVFAQKLTEHFLVKFIDTFTPTTSSSSSSSSSSAIKDRLKNKLLHLRNSASSEIDENKVFAGNETLKKEYTVLSRIKPVFQEVLRDVLTSSLSSTNEDKISLTSDPDEWKRKLSEFWDHVFDDYLQYERPLPFRKLTWKYDTADKTNEIKGLFDDSDIPKGTTLPTLASYFFPYVSSATQSKFKQFVEHLKSSSSSSTQTDLSTHSDESKIDFVVPISGIADSSASSQEAISILELAQYFSSQIADKATGVHYRTSDTYNMINYDYGYISKQKFKLLEDASKASTDNTDNCTKETSKDKDGSIASLKPDKLSDKSVHDIFCINKDSSWFKTNKELSDFFYLKVTEQTQQTQQTEKHWIIFRDKKGVHGISLDTELLKNIKSSGSEWKKEWKKRILKLKDAPEFNLQKSLEQHLDVHFDRLVLGYWDKFHSSSSHKFKDVATNLSKLLLKDYYSSKLIPLRDKLFRDYEEAFQNNLIKDGGKFKFHPKLAFAGRFPYKVSDSGYYFYAGGKRQAVTTNVDPLTKHLELSLYLDFMPENKSTNDSIGQISSAFKNYESQLSSLFSKSTSTSTKTYGNKQYFEFSGSGVNTVSTQGTSEVSEEEVLNTILISILKDKGIADVIMQSKLGERSTYFDLSNWKMKQQQQQQSILGNSKQDLFKSESSESSESSDQLFNTLVKNHLLEAHSTGLANSSSQRLFLQDSLKNLPRALESLDRNLNYKLSTYGTDTLTARSTLLETYTINYLADNSLEKFRLHLRDTLPKNSFSAFLFSKKYAADGLCAPEGSDPTATDAGYLKYDDSKLVKNPLVDRSASVQKEYICPVSKEDWSWSSTFLEGGTKVTKMVGYKGLVSGDWKTHFSEDVVKLIEAKSSYWSDATSLNEYIDNGIKSSAQMDGLIEKLKSIFPTHDWNTVSLSNASYRFDWRSDNRHDLNKLSRDLEARRKGLKDYINRTNLPFKSFHGWLRDDKGGYLVQDSKGDKYSVFLSQIKYDDVSTPEKWKAYLKTINADLIIRELVRASKNPKVQHKAIFDQLLDSQKGLGSIQTGDYRLKEALNYQWFSNAQSS